MKNNNLIIILIVLLLSVLSLSMFLKTPLGNKTEYKIEPRVEKIIETKKEISSSVLGWLRVQGTNIDYPIIYKSEYSDEDEIDYLWSAGFSNFGIGEEEENRITVYGHNIRNISSKPLMNDNSLVRFEELMYFTDYSFAKDNQYIQLTYGGEDHLYRIYAVYFTSTLDDYGQVMITNEATTNYINNSIKNSIYKYNVKVDNTDKIISLVTCTRFFGEANNLTQFKIDAREVRENEEAINSRVTKTSNYDIIEEIIGG